MAVSWLPKHRMRPSLSGRSLLYLFRCIRAPLLPPATSQVTGAFCPRRPSLMLLAELRQEPALLRVLRNSPRAMPQSGFPIIVVHITKTR